MQDVTLIIMAAGSASRFKQESGPKKQWLRVGRDPLWLDVANRFSKIGEFGEILITAHPDEERYMESFSPYRIIRGGESRQESLQNSISVVATPYVMVTDVARACVPESVVLRILSARLQGECVVPYLKASDTIVVGQHTVNRDEVRRIQTPQLSRTEILREALNTDILYTDESSAIRALGGNVVFVEGSEYSEKITYRGDLAHFGCIKPPSSACINGIGFDVHSFEVDKPMMLGGVRIDSSFGFKAHSDGDVLIHALIDALLGAAGAGDIGEWFPDTDPRYKGVDSTKLLDVVVDFIRNVGFTILHIDATILAEAPRISPYKALIRKNLSELLSIPISSINIKATTMEKMGFIGRKEGAGVQCVATLGYFDWKNSCRS